MLQSEQPTSLMKRPSARSQRKHSLCSVVQMFSANPSRHCLSSEDCCMMRAERAGSIICLLIISFSFLGSQEPTSRGQADSLEMLRTAAQKIPPLQLRPFPITQPRRSSPRRPRVSTSQRARPTAAGVSKTRPWDRSTSSALPPKLSMAVLVQLHSH